MHVTSKISWAEKGGREKGWGRWVVKFDSAPEDWFNTGRGAQFNLEYADKVRHTGRVGRG